MLNLRLTLPTLPKVVARLEAIAKDWGAWRRPTLGEARDIMRAEVEKALAAGGYSGAKWAPRSEVAERLRPGGGPENLVRLLRDDVTQSTASIRLQFPGVSLVHHGGTTAAGSMIPGRTVPARPLLRLEDSAAKRIKKAQREAFERTG